MGSLETKMTAIGDLVQLVASEALQLPEIQRPYVWTKPQVRDLLDSLYRGYPIGTMLIWQIDDGPLAKPISGGGTSSSLHTTGYLLDGQQRLTSLHRVFNVGDPQIRFNVETEEFQVSNALLAKDPRWVSVIDVATMGTFAVMDAFGLMERPDKQSIGNRLGRLEHLKNQMVPVNVLRGFGYEEVTEIFVRVNSKGTRLRVAELAIAQLAFRLPGLVTNEIKSFEDDLDDRGWEIDLSFLLRCLTAVATGQSRFAALGGVDDESLKVGWQRTKAAVETFLNLLANNLGIESASWLPSSTALVVPVAYLARTPAKDVDVDGLLHWFLSASAWGRYAQATETALDQDLKVLDEPDPFTALTDRIKQSVGRLHVAASDLDDAGLGSPLFLMAYLACRGAGATDWWTGIKLSSTNLGTAHTLELHHIFPKAIVNKLHTRRDVNELANLAFLSQQANRSIGKQEPRVYLEKIAEERLTAQFIPLDRGLWTTDRFQDFLAARRALLAEGINAVFRSFERPAAEIVGEAVHAV